MPSTRTSPARRALRLSDGQMAVCHDLYAATRSLDAVRTYVAENAGYPDATDSQLMIQIGGHGWRAGTDLGDQTYQRRMERLGRPMPRLGRRGELTGAIPAPTVAPTARTNRVLTGRRFGLELEFNRGSGTYGQRERIVADLNARGVAAIMDDGRYTHQVPTMWAMRTDGTVTGGELVGPPTPLTEAGLSDVREAFRAVKAQGGSPGQGQGLHVHHDVTDFHGADMPRLVRNLRHAEGAFLAYVPSYRYNGTGTYRANRIGDYGWRAYEAAANDGSLYPMANRHGRDRWNRYSSFNLCAVLVYGTVEFRAMGNSLNPIKVSTWIEVGSALIAWTKAGHELAEVTGYEALANLLAADGFLDAATAARFITECDRRAGRTTSRAAA